MIIINSYKKNLKDHDFTVGICTSCGVQLESEPTEIYFSDSHRLVVLCKSCTCELQDLLKDIN